MKILTIALLTLSLGSTMALAGHGNCSKHSKACASGKCKKDKSCCKNECKKCEGGSSCKKAKCHK